MKNETVLLQQARTHDSFYLYDETVIDRYTARLKQDFPGVHFLYSIKTNSHPLVVKSVFSQAFGADAASLGEVLIAVDNGLPPQEIYFSAPGKTDNDIAAALSLATLIADSVTEVERIQTIAQRMGVTARIGVRINPDFSFGGGEGAPSKFGIDEEQALTAIPLWNTFSQVEVVGLHVHLRSQELSADVLAEYYGYLFGLAQRFQDALGHPLQFLNMGSGIGIPYSPLDPSLDTAALGVQVSRLMADFRASLPGVQILIEVGRYAVGKSGVYVTKVLDKKISHGKTFIILKNTLNGFIRPSLAQLVVSYSSNPQPPASEPLFTHRDAFTVVPLLWREEQEVVTLVGNLCTAADVIAKDVELPRLEVGDVVAITNAGSYAAVLSPMQFSSQTPPAQLFLTREGDVVELR